MLTVRDFVEFASENWNFPPFSIQCKAISNIHDLNRAAVPTWISVTSNVTLVEPKQRETVEMLFFCGEFQSWTPKLWWCKFLLGISSGEFSALSMVIVWWYPTCWFEKHEKITLLQIVCLVSLREMLVVFPRWTPNSTSIQIFWFSPKFWGQAQATKTNTWNGEYSSPFEPCHSPRVITLFHFNAVENPTVVSWYS